DQALRLAGSRQFASVAQYEGFLFGLLRKRNASRGERCEREQTTLRALPPTRWPEYDEEVLSVSREALCRVGKQAYSVPARYAGERLRVRIWETALEFVWNGEVVERTERRRGKPGVFINWRHIIGALLRKPGALKGWRYREAMFPNRRWRTLYDL